MNVRRYMLDPITHAVKTMMEAGYSKEVMLGALKIDEKTLEVHLNYLYAKVFDISSKNWVNNEDHNKTFIKMQEQWLNDRLRAVGHVFLNEAYDALGVARSSQGQMVGWFRKPYSNFVEFDIVDTTSDDGFIISFNPDGVIYNRLPTF